MTDTTSPVVGGAFRHARTAAAVQQWLGEVAGVKVVAVDTETTGWDPLADRLLLVQISAGPDHPVLVLDTDSVDARALQPLLADPGVLKVFHHAAFDLRFLWRAGLEITRVADTMLAQKLLDGGETPAGGHGLAAIAGFRLGVQLDKSVRATFAEATAINGAQLRYAADDAAATWAVFDQQWRELVGHGLVQVAKLEFAALPVLAGMQLRGVAFDAPRWRSLVGALEQRLPQLEQAVQDLLVTDDSPQDLFGPEPVNLDAPEQVRGALARVGVALDSTKESALREADDHPAVTALLAYREVAKITSGWGGDWAERVAHPTTGRVHADWRQIVGTGRISCSEPNLTQVPKEAGYRACFGGAAGRALIVADYSQQELRILAAVAGDAALTEVFRRGGDLHRTTAAMAFGVAEEQVTAPQRVAAKALNFGLMYGMGVNGFARATGLPPADAQGAMERYFATFPRVAAWLAEAEQTGRRTGRVRTPLGRIRLVDTSRGGGSATMSRNAPIQGAGADMTKLALAEVATRLAARWPQLGTATRVARDGIVLVIHDELVVEVAADCAEEARTLVVDGMLAAAGRILGDVPAVVDAAVQPRWG